MGSQSAVSTPLLSLQPCRLCVQASQWLHHARSEGGSSMVEMALSIVILLTFVFGIMNFSLAAYTLHFVSHAAREATRYALVRGSSCSGFASACPAQPADVQSYVQGMELPGIDPSLMTVTTTWPTTGASCTPSVTPCNNPGNRVKVTVNYQFPLKIIFIPATTLNMTSTSEMVISQ
jgi:Flp pilus assembly protein TadG